MIIQLALFNERLKNDREALMAEVGSPDHLTRHAIGRDDDGKLIFVFDAKNGPIRDGYTELLDVATVNNGSMLVTMQKPTDNLGALSTDEFNQIGVGLIGYYGKETEVKFSAMADPELDGQSGVIFFDKKQDADDFNVQDVSAELSGYALDGDETLVYADQQLILISTTQLLENLRDDSVVIEAGAAKIEVVGENVKMARACAINIGEEGVKAWAYVQKDDGGKLQKYYLDKDDLRTIGVEQFEADYVTTSRDGKHLIMVGRVVSDETETYQVTRRAVASKTGQAATTA